MGKLWIYIITILPSLSFAAQQQLPGINVVSSAEIIKLILSLGVVIVLILLATFFIKRSNGLSQRFGQGQLIKVLSVTTLGVREKILLVDIAGKQLVLGVSSHGGINTLHVFDEPVIDSKSSAQPPVFAKYLQGILNRETNK